ncbi:hypothetical protein D9619_011755 [Psilocybe cf. subviscida]|uniref:malate dehydrogenase n=1 Tax=Psilocybe cf. subviscida TaxID=2480587 RepID=A0A8H5EVX1_9AGAR|nr:hypothetical protein D9619_011755 [Psilocybe cf. subviscida]
MVKAVVLGAAGGIGQPLALLLKANPLVTELGLFDIVNTPGVAADLSHISTPAKVEGYLPPDDGLKKALTGADVVVIPAGVPRKPGMTRDDLFKASIYFTNIYDGLFLPSSQINAGIIRDLATGIATTAPKAFVLVISNPVNSTVPIVAEIFKKHGVFDPKRQVIGDLSLSKEIVVPVVGGHSGVTIVPLLSQSSHPLPSGFSKESLDTLVNRIQFGGDEVVKAKDGAGSATLSMAYAGAEFAAKIIRAVKGEKGIVTPTYVSAEVDPSGSAALAKELGEEVAYFSTNVELGTEGVTKIIPLGKITEAEQALVKAALPELLKNISTGVSFVAPPKL